MLQARRVLVGVGGGIAAYKVAEVVSQLFQSGAEVRVILTTAAQQFITPLTLATLSRHPAYTDQDFWQAHHNRPLHIELGEWAELFLIAPLTANTLGKLALGLADNLLTNTVLASRCLILLAPAMNTDMWEQVSVQRNWQLLTQDPRYHWLEPTEGLLACDRRGRGRMAEPDVIIRRVQSLLWPNFQRDLSNKTLLISAGGTQEYLDPVRFLGNPASGKMGLALAQSALDRGARVILVHGPLLNLPLPTSPQLRSIAVTSAAQMEQALLENLAQADWVVMAAAVADVKPAHYSPTKLPKQALPQALALEPVPDIVAKLSQQRHPSQIIVGFAAQTGEIVSPALEKLQRKKLDVIVANPVDQAEAGFGTDTNQGVILDRFGHQQTIAPGPKLALAHALWDYLQTHFCPLSSVGDNEN
ncbi:bifunctional phosphopantothenoylcysteine decarboxylase/phosphopantothenate--cysteine ligase CoaBC [Synechocystis sp. LKSZ1]|uniref:bifunctional phosphopantothenoylcysteine decarboxylase/phosphopantothenate--cysteine ligase CoaBC n=1 Tax=Synechocystis sp. LKSZ1 TaxID=3144951 RepID=UPI00336C1107